MLEALGITALALTALSALFLVALIVTTRDPVTEPVAGFLGAALIGLAVGLTLTPIMWLIVFARHRRIAYRGDWVRAARRGGWIGLIVAIFIVLRLQSALELPIALFIVVQSYLAFRFRSAQQVLEGEPAVVVHHGEIVEPVLRRERMTEYEILQSARDQGIADLADVEIAILEPDGKLSFITEDHRRLPKQEHRFD